MAAEKPETDEKASAKDTAGAKPTGAEAAVMQSLDDHPEAEGTLPAVIEAAAQDSRAVKAMLNVGLEVVVVLGSTRMPINQLLELSRGSIVELDRKIGAPVELHVSERVVARGDLVKVGEDRLGVSLTQIVKDYVPD